MGKYVLSTCSTVDIDKKYMEDNNIIVVNFQFILDGKSYKDDFGESIPFAKFYELMRKGATPTSSQPSPDAYVEKWETALSEGNDILHISLSSGISGAFNSACIARDIMMEKYPDRKVIVLDSLSASGGYGCLLKLTNEKKQEGVSIEELEKYVIETRPKIRHVFYSSDLTSFVRGGRISQFAGAVGGILNIFPVMECVADGKLKVFEKVRGESKAIKTVINYVKENTIEGFDFNKRFFLTHSDCMDLAQNLINELSKMFPKLKAIEVSSIGTTIGCHTGPGTVALFFLGKDRK